MKFDVKGIDKDILINLFQNMLKSRMIEEKMIILLRQGKVSKWFSGMVKRPYQLELQRL